MPAGRIEMTPHGGGPIGAGPAVMVRRAASPKQVLNAQEMWLLPSRSVQYGPFAPTNIVRSRAPMFVADIFVGSASPVTMTETSSAFSNASEPCTNTYDEICRSA